MVPGIEEVEYVAKRSGIQSCSQDFTGTTYVSFRSVSFVESLAVAVATLTKVINGQFDRWKKQLPVIGIRNPQRM